MTETQFRICSVPLYPDAQTSVDTTRFLIWVLHELPYWAISL